MSPELRFVKILTLGAFLWRNYSQLWRHHLLPVAGEDMQHMQKYDVVSHNDAISKTKECVVVKVMRFCLVGSLTISETEKDENEIKTVKNNLITL